MEEEVAPVEEATLHPVVIITLLLRTTFGVPTRKGTSHRLDGEAQVVHPVKIVYLRLQKSQRRVLQDGE